MLNRDRDIPRAFTVPGIAHQQASVLGVRWALEQGEVLGAPLAILAPGKQNLHDLKDRYPALHALVSRGVPVHTWRDGFAARGVVIALWPDEQHLLEVDERSSTVALVAVTWGPRDTLSWAHAKNAEPLGGPRPHIDHLRTVDPVVAAAIDSLGIVVGQHKTADQRYRAAVAKGLTILRDAGYRLDPESLHTHAIGHGWRASNADKLREVASRINEGRIIQGMKTAPLRDDVLDHWRELAARPDSHEDA